DDSEKLSLKNSEESSFYETYNEKDVLRSISLLRADESCGDCHDVESGDVLAVVSIRQSFERTKENLASQKLDAVWIGVIACSLTFILIFYFFGRNIGKPIDMLISASKEFAAGNFKGRVNLKNRDELGLLADSFNDMADKINLQLQYLNNLPLPVYVINNDFEIIYANKRCSEFLELGDSQLLGTKCFENLKLNNCNTENCTCKKAMLNDSNENHETTFQINGKEMHVLLSGSPIKNENGEVIGALETITDISKSKEMENYLERNVNNMLQEMAQFADGDLTVKLVPERKGDIIARLFNGFNLSVERIRDMILNVREAISATAAAGTQISSSSEEMAAGAQIQSTRSEEVVVSIDEMTRTIIDSAQNISSAAKTSRDAGELASEGAKIVNETIIGMNRIDEVVSKAANTVKTLGESSDKIGEIVKVINEIADQTNLLALNAAIEAARAGEHGRGFAVVADEVRKLAERTTSATTEISDMITAIQTDTSEAVDSINSGTEEVRNGKDLANSAGESLRRITDATRNVVDLITQVAAASEEQSANSEQISTSIEGINNVTQESATGIDQVAKSAEDLRYLTENLKTLIDDFKISSEAEISNKSVDANKLQVH
ncbi:MAG: methyl-accepting chemotaxis protein, partial [Melioribacteraceae bacterium]|nr:methyl-accepting chemotaxis protein [Melioribacteraceae bacterium]